MENLTEVLIEQLRDLYNAETQTIEALPLMAKACKSKTLRKAFEDHVAETKEQIARLESCAEELDCELGGHTCKAMKGLIKEAHDALNEEYKQPALKDVMLVASAQRMKHYEIAGYGNVIALANYLDLSEIAENLQASIEEEGQVDKLMTSICEEEIFKSVKE
jgi:ferritin-like metal-binding protein YciE